MNIDNTNLRFETIKILNGQTESPIIEQKDRVLVGIKTPIAIDGNNFTFKISESSSGTFVDYYNGNGDQIIITTAVNRWIGILGTDFSGTQYIKLVQGAVSTADRDYILMFKGFSGA